MRHPRRSMRTIKLTRIGKALRAELERRARMEGTTLDAYILKILEREVAKPDPLEVFARIRSREPVDLGRPAAYLIRDERDWRSDN